MARRFEVRPQKGAQEKAMQCKADIMIYGGMKVPRYMVTCN